jgi:hypothetical protein
VQQTTVQQTTVQQTTVQQTTVQQCTRRVDLLEIGRVGDRLLELPQQRVQVLVVADVAAVRLYLSTINSVIAYGTRVLRVFWGLTVLGTSVRWEPIRLVLWVRHEAAGGGMAFSLGKLPLRAALQDCVSDELGKERLDRPA